MLHGPALLTVVVPSRRSVAPPSTPAASPEAAARRDVAAAPRIPSLLVVGGDAVLAARPATAVQLAHAGMRVGFDAVVPASWGDELVAAAAARALGDRGGEPAIFCACPHVAQRMLGVGPELAPLLVSTVAPPVAVARYLRRLYAPEPVRLTYVGGCPSAQSDAYDARVAPIEFLRLLAERGLTPSSQPEAFDSVVPPDRRRFQSLPGGVPALGALRGAGCSHTVVELTGDDIVAELAQHLLDGHATLVDGATRLGCACAGAGAASDRSPDARAHLVALEPPRAMSPVVEMDLVPIGELMLPLPAASRQAADLVAALDARRAGHAVQATEPAPPRRASGERAVERHVDAAADVVPPRRRSPTLGTPVVRPPAGVGPTSRGNDGRVLPRAYVARRKATGRPSAEVERIDEDDES